MAPVYGEIMKKRSEDGQGGGNTVRAVRSDEADLWKQVVQDVTPLNPGSIRITRAPLNPEIVKQARQSDPISVFGTDQACPSDPDLRHGKAPGLDKRTEMRMRRGKVRLDARIDLHGLSRQEAHRALIAFLRGSQDAGRKSVLVITGKGGRQNDEEDIYAARTEGGILRRAVPKWLNEAPLRAMVHAFSHAAPKDGGVGALYVMLKRKR